MMPLNIFQKRKANYHEGSTYPSQIDEDRVTKAFQVGMTICVLKIGYLEID